MFKSSIITQWCTDILYLTIRIYMIAILIDNLHKYTQLTPYTYLLFHHTRTF